MNRQLADSDFRNIYFIDGDRKHICYRTGMTVYEEVYDNGRFMSAGWNCAGYTLNVLDDFPTRLDNRAFREPQSFDIEADGMSLGWDWSFWGFEQSEELIETTASKVIHGIVTLESRVKPITVRVHTILDGSPVFSRWLEIVNTTDKPVNINEAAPVCGGVEIIDRWKDYMKGAPDDSRIYSLGYMDYSTWGHEGYFKWHDLPSAEYGITGKYKSDRHRHPIFMLRNNLLGSVMIAQMGWSGGYRFNFFLDTDEGRSKLSFRMELESQKPLIILDPGESFETPCVHIGMVQGELDDAVNGMHAHLRRSVFTLPDARGKRGWVVGGMGPERLMDVRATKHFADTLAAVGAETLIIDAGWYCPLGTECQEWHPRTGDWYPDQERYPNGIKEIRDYIHSKGLLFGLWLDIERLGDKSEAAKKHPEWISQSYINGHRHSQMNMADPEAVAWAEAELTRVIDEYKVDLFRLDYNLSTDDLLNKIDRGNGPENAYVRYYKNTNAMYHRLRKKFPNVVFENCAGGGGRTDIGFVANFTHTWVSDWNVAPRSFTITNGMTMALPPEWVDRLMSGMNCHTRASLDFQVRSTIFGKPTTNDYNAVGSETNPDQIAFVRHALDIYKKHIRPYINDSRIFHHTPELVSGLNGAGGVTEQPQGTGIMERASSDGKHGVLGVFKLSDAGDEEVITVYPRGIDASLAYAITFDNSGMTARVAGYELMNTGLRVRLPGAMTSELIIYSAAE